MAKKTTPLSWFILIAFLLAAATFGLLSLLAIGSETGAGGFLVGFLMAAIPVPIYVAFALWIDRFEPEPGWLLFLTFVWGAAIAVFFALIANVTTAAILGAIGGARAGGLAAIVSAPFAEEMSKGFALFLLFLAKRDEFDDVTDGIVYATMVGLGFAMTENIEYYGRSLHSHDVGPLGLFIVRGIMGPFTHPLFTSMTGIGLGIARVTRSRALRWIAPFAGLGAAMFLHFIWNASAIGGVMFFVTYFFFMVPVFVGVIVIGIVSMMREAKIIRLHLENLRASGVLSDDDLRVVSSVRRRIAADMDAFSRGGVRLWNLRRKFHRVATDAAFHSWRMSRGEQSPDDASLWDEAKDSLVAIRRDLGLPSLAVAAPAVATAPKESFGAIYFESGPLSGKRFAIRREGLSIGRDPASANIVVADPRVSKRHVWIGLKDGGIVAVDQKSTNGTFVNSPTTRVSATRIWPGDVLILSNDAARLRIESSTAG